MGYEYYVEQTRGYFITSDVPLTDDEAQVLVENGVGSLKIVEWKVQNTKE